MLVTFFDIFVQVLQLTFFLVTFSIITHHIIHTGSSRVSLKNLLNNHNSRPRPLVKVYEYMAIQVHCSFGTYTYYVHSGWGEGVPEKQPKGREVA